jgi:hypothetical protein
MEMEMMKIFRLTLGMLICLSAVGCKNDVTAVWTGDTGIVPPSLHAPAGFAITPSKAQELAETHYGKKKVIQHIYSDSMNYYVVNGFPRPSPSEARKNGVKVNGTTGQCSRMDDTANQAPEDTVRKLADPQR